MDTFQHDFATLTLMEETQSFDKDWKGVKTDYPMCRNRLKRGKQRMKKSRVVVCGLARDVSPYLPHLINLIETLGSMFMDYQIVIYENDSTDNTLEILETWADSNKKIHVLTDHLGDKKWGPVKDIDRTMKMAEYRNKYLNFTKDKYTDWDYIVVLDLDLESFDIEGYVTPCRPGGDARRLGTN